MTPNILISCIVLVGAVLFVNRGIRLILPHTKIRNRFTLFVLVFSILAVFNGIQSIRNVYLMQNGIRAKGMITRIAPEASLTMWYFNDATPIVTFVDGKGNIINARGCRNCAGSVGDEVSVLYSKNNSVYNAVDDESLYFPLQYAIVFGLITAWSVYMRRKVQVQLNMLYAKISKFKEGF